MSPIWADMSAAHTTNFMILLRNHKIIIGIISLVMLTSSGWWWSWWACCSSNHRGKLTNDSKLSFASANHMWQTGRRAALCSRSSSTCCSASSSKMNPAEHNYCIQDDFVQGMKKNLWLEIIKSLLLLNKSKHNTNMHRFSPESWPSKLPKTARRESYVFYWD